MEFWSKDGKCRSQAFFGEVFSDGSCSKSKFPGHSRASWALIKLDEHLEVSAYLLGTVWSSLPQTSPVAEFVAAAALAQVAAPDTRLYTDYKGVVTKFGGPNEEALRAGNYFAGIQKSAIIQKCFGNIVEINKVKAHQAVESLPLGSDETRRATGNQAADEYAKGALRKHEANVVPAEEEEHFDLARKVAILAGRVLPFWSPARKPGVKLARRPGFKVERLTPLHPRTEKHRHEWNFCQGMWRPIGCAGTGWAAQGRRRLSRKA